LRLSLQDGGEHPGAIWQQSDSHGAPWRAAAQTAPCDVPPPSAGSEAYRDTSGIAAAGVCELDVAAAGRAGRGDGDRGIDQPRDPAPNP
jgi:hypothetical protein